MATAGVAAGEARKCNQVRQEQIWKDYVHHEEKATKAWKSTWGFLCDDYKKMREEIFKVRQRREEKEGDDEEVEQDDEEPVEEEEEEVEEEMDDQERVDSDDDGELLKLPPLSPAVLQTQKVSKVPFPLPLTTSREIGWRSSRPECNLERFGKWARPKKSILKHFNWTIYACP
ncbi:PREDICTED: uncharacterized protein C20orf85-like [Amphimedon queenslandica]|uniref:Uncharacterized protein n=2 Tax=Amphimedon queenslandica TaxID=400682 RepID=A0AAN0IKZ2_AMPQE|nr:PREDICTED: uncharacterized protein C20orf85-like [Amphimedon queenslandica]|eukprot:XP_011403227.1 PREDICTED: uncharacterized protein C20orf85-like [Amphimedon queenslandica]